MSCLNYQNIIFDLTKSNVKYFVKREEANSCRTYQEDKVAHQEQWSLAATPATIQTTSAAAVYPACTKWQNLLITPPLFPMRNSNIPKNVIETKR